MLEAGDKVPADCRVVESFSLRVNNATITGESLPHSRNADASHEADLIHSCNVLLAGTMIVSGEVTALTFATGAHTSPQELGCDDSARMKVTAYLNGAFVGTNLTTARYPGTWPSETLSFGSARGFNSVVIHYDARPTTCQDWGPIFMADNMAVTVAPSEIVLTDVVKLASGAFQFGFTNTPGRSFTIFSTTNLSGPFTNWTPLGGVTEVVPGEFQFTDSQATNSWKRFYRVRSP